MLTIRTTPRTVLSGLLLVAAAISLPPANASAGVVDPGIPDTIRVQSVQGFRGGTAIVPVRMFNDEILGGITLAFSFDPVAFTLDSFSFVGSVAEPLVIKNVRIDSASGLVDIAAVTFDSTTSISPGQWLAGTLHFSVDAAAPVGDYLIDTTSIDLPGPGIIQTSFSTLQNDTVVNETVFPRFVAGHISIPERPATHDSLWVAPVTAAPGGTVVVDINLENEASLVGISIPLTYSSPALTLDSVIFDGTRGILAGKSRQAQRLDDSLKVLLTLEFFDTAPLTAGKGPIARLKFTVADTAANQQIPIDTAAYLGIVTLAVTTTSAEGGFTFVPQFAPGDITVDISTDVEDDTDPALPTEFALRQNYPNPFNPSTTIEFSLPHSAPVTLEVFNLLGQQVRTVLNETRSAGVHRITFDAVNDNGTALASGVYFYRLRAGSATLTRKMTLLK